MGRFPEPPFRVRTAGHVYGRLHHSTPGSRQGDVMLTVFLAGRGTYIQGRRRGVVERGMVGLVPDSRPGILLTDPRDPYDHYYCRFGGGYARRLAAEVRRRRGGRFFRHERCAEAAGILSRMGEIWRAELPAALGRAELLLAEVLLLLASGPEPDRGLRLTPEALEQYFRDRIAEPFSLARVAGHFGMSRASLCRAARRLTGRTALEVAEAVKIEWARSLLASGAAGVAEAARMVGYQDPFYFSRVFRKRAGLAPRDLLPGRRKRCKPSAPARGKMAGDGVKP